MSVFYETLKKDNAAYDWLQNNGYKPFGAYGKYVIVEIDGKDVDFPDFRVAAESLGWMYQK